MNIPPNKEGRLHSNDVDRLREFGNVLKDTFNKNIAENKVVKADSVWQDDINFAANNIIDKDYDSYWAAKEEKKTGIIEIDLQEEKEFDVICLQEYIPLGQRIKEFNIEVFSKGQWIEIFKGTTVGYKRYVRIVSIIGSKIRVNIKNLLKAPLINNISVYKQPSRIELIR